MPINEAKAKSSRRALRDLSNNNKNGRFSSKSENVKKKFPEKIKQDAEEKTVRARKDDDDALDRLLLVQSNLSSLIRQIDELVVQGINHKAMSRQGRKEIESFTSVLSEMLSSLKPWVPRFQKVLPSPSLQAEKELEQFEVESPEQTKMDSLISPSPLVSWRADCNVERGRQLFLLTPLPVSKVLSSKQQHLTKSAFEKITSNTLGLQSHLNISRDANADLFEGEGIKPTPSKASDFVAAVTGNMQESGLVSSPIFQKKDQSMLLMTPCLKMSPPRSCVLLEPVSESCHRGNDRFHKSTPFPIEIHNCSGSETYESSGSDNSEGLALKYPELLGIQQAYKSGFGKKYLESSPDWLFSPVKSCVLLEPLDEKSLDKVGSNCNLPITCAFSQQTNKSLSEANDIKEPVGSSLAPIESTPLWKEPESTVRTGKRPGENTLKKELWTKFEAASTHGFHYNSSAFQRTSKKGFLDMLDEVFCDEESTISDSLR